MTENEAIKILKKDSCYECAQGTDSPFNCEYGGCRVAEAAREAIKALEETQQYRAIGTVEELQDMKSNYFEALSDWRKYRKIGTLEECRAAVEKQTAKKIVRRKATDEDIENGLRDFITIKGMIFHCPTCGCCIAVDGMESCWKCGQILDWSDEE